MERLVIIVIVLVGLVLPFGLWWVHDRRERRRERIAREIAGWYGDGDLYAGPKLVLWADPRCGRGHAAGAAHGPASSRPD